MMSTRNTGRIVLGGLVLLVTLATIPTAGWLYQKGQQHLGSDYTAFTGNLVRAQHEIVRFRQLSNDLTATLEPTRYRDRLLNLLPILENRRHTLLSGLSRNAPNDELYEFAEAELDRLTPHLDSLEQTLINLDIGSETELGNTRIQALTLESELAFVYSQLHEAMHQAAADQKQFIWLLSLMIALLIAILILFSLALIASLIKMWHQKSALQALSITDSLTGLYNRREFEDRAQKELVRLSRMRGSLSMVLLDVDHFKVINDRFGHPAGDAVLQQLARVLETSIREYDTLARMGGEEFAILMPDAGAPGAMGLSQRLRQAVANMDLPAPVRDNTALTISLGVATLNSMTDSTEPDLSLLYSRADRALYKAKSRGRNQVHTADDLGGETYHA